VTVNWHEDAARDWSLTAWGVDGPVTVAYTGDHYDDKDTDHMPQYDDNNRQNPVIALDVDEVVATCKNTDEGSTGDVDGDMCAKY
jgi:hypothetical protein